MPRSSRSFPERQGLVEGTDYRTLRFNSDVGKHGDTGASEVEVVRAVLDGRADAGAIGSPFWRTAACRALVPEGALTEIWTSPPYNHCMFTARPDLDPALERRFAEALFGMSYDNPSHRAVLDAEGLRRWVSPQLDGYDSLRQASSRQGFFNVRLVGWPRDETEFRLAPCFLRRGEGEQQIRSRAVEDRRQPAPMLAFPLEGAAHRGEGLGQRKDLAGDQQIGVLGSHRMPIDAFSRDRDLWREIGARKGDAFVSAKPRSAMRRMTRSSSPIPCASRKRRNSSASSSMETVAANRTRNPSARARSMPRHARAQVPARDGGRAAPASGCRG